VKRARPQGKHQREVMAQLRRQPQNSYPIPPGTTNEGIMVDKGLAIIEGDRFRIVR
jgi:hypothetical protein